MNRPRFIDEFMSYIAQIINGKCRLEKDKFWVYYSKYQKLIVDIFTENFGKMKSYKKEDVAHQIFLKKIKSAKVYSKYTIIAITESLERIKSGIVNCYEQDDCDTLIGVLRLLSDLLFDSLIFFNKSNLFYKSEKIEFGVSKSNSISSSDAYSASMKLFKEVVNRNSSEIVAIRYTSIFLIRQSIELKIKNVLGIVNITDQNGEAIPIKQKIFVEFIKDNSDKITFPIDYKVMEKIYEWTNLYIHHGIFDSIWVIDWAYIMLAELFKPHIDDTIINLLKQVELPIDGGVLQKLQGVNPSQGKSIVFNIYGSIKIDKEFYKTQMISLLKEKISQNKRIDVKDIRISVIKPECMLI
ncbi:MAG: hypothetical protein P9M05_08785 [Candidatus Stygibacter australis]|nr:hypothetical protein [Candidatus Stygibacter australis]